MKNGKIILFFKKIVRMVFVIPIFFYDKYKSNKKRNFYKSQFYKKYQNSNFWPSGEYCFDNLDLSKHSYGELNVQIFSNGILKIGECVSIASEVKFLLGGEHPLNTISTFPFNVYYSNNIHYEYKDQKEIKDNSITIEDDVWIGLRATILSGVTIHQGAVIGACAVVTKDVPPYAIVVGNPARVIRYRFSSNIIDKLLKYANYKKLTEKKVQDNIEKLVTTELTEDNIEEFLKIFNDD